MLPGIILTEETPQVTRLLIRTFMIMEYDAQGILIFEFFLRYRC